MTFASPWVALIAAGIAVPLLMLLYFLKLRRQRVQLGSTLLWQKSFEDLQVNAPFQRLRWTLLLFVQLLLVLAIVLALAQPELDSGETPASRIILLIDRSASMNTFMPTTGGAVTTRLDRAKAQAMETISTMRDAGEDRQMMVMTFGATPTVLCGFESNVGALRAIVNGIQPTDEESNLDDALRAVSAFAQRGENTEQSVPEVVLLSDGGVGTSSRGSGFALGSGTFRFIPIGAPAETSAAMKDDSYNIGIVSCSVRRAYDDPAVLQVFARIISTSATPRDVSLRVEVDGAIEALRRVTIPSASSNEVGEATLSVDLERADGGLIAVRLLVDDALPSDDVAWLIAPESRGVRIALVYPLGDSPDAFLDELLTALKPAAIRRIPAPPDGQMDISFDDIDLVVFDRVSARLPGVASITFGALPIGVEPVDAPATPTGGQYLLSWERQHPLMRYVELDSLVFSGFDGMREGPGMTVLARGRGGAIISEMRTRGARHVVVGFRLQSSNWPAFVSLAVFVQNAMEYLTMSEERANGLVFRPGEAARIRAAKDVTTVNVEQRRTPGMKADGDEPSAGDDTMDLRIDSIPVDEGGLVVLPPLRRAGVYAVEGGEPPFDRIAVSMLSDRESDTRVRDTLAVAEGSPSFMTGEVSGPRRLWPFVVIAALVLALLEWLLYCWRLRWAPAG
ncbi:MAG: VWA domain-containing protein [Phycisphaerales bacterium]|nr:VWA domain-containing protein [Phycisphaerales bacterium]